MPLTVMIVERRLKNNMITVKDNLTANWVKVAKIILRVLSGSPRSRRCCRTRTLAKIGEHSERVILILVICGAAGERTVHPSDLLRSDPLWLEERGIRCTNLALALKEYPGVHKIEGRSLGTLNMAEQPVVDVERQKGNFHL